MIFLLSGLDTQEQHIQIKTHSDAHVELRHTHIHMQVRPLGPGQGTASPKHPSHILNLGVSLTPPKSKLLEESELKEVAKPRDPSSHPSPLLSEGLLHTTCSCRNLVGLASALTRGSFLHGQVPGRSGPLLLVHP